ncbi:electron transport complex subunit RsxG [Litchfieldella xinjiangensis]|uniref:electron transport complex subunit RsxG n=1 Tax=Litchfieldella xinjiangensis TaxID=1166948 RepID=UPI0005BE03BA|nr:electron transport complex subunit RsxG [Halomonas xinjiangensis]
MNGPRPVLESMWRGALGLGLFAIVTAGVVSGTRALTAERIAENRLESQYRVLEEVLPEALAQVDVEQLLANTATLPASEALGQPDAFTVWRAGQGEAQVAILPVVARDGYSGDIALLVGIDRQRHVTGVRVIRHQETPGLGDKIERRKSDWVESFEGRSLGDPAPERWTVGKQGGEFDAFTGATVTPRAVIGAVRRSLEFSAEHHALLFDIPENEEGTP